MFNLAVRKIYKRGGKSSWFEDQIQISSNEEGIPNKTQNENKITFPGCDRGIIWAWDILGAEVSWKECAMSPWRLFQALPGWFPAVLWFFRNCATCAGRWSVGLKFKLPPPLPDKKGQNRTLLSSSFPKCLFFLMQQFGHNEVTGLN